MSTIEGNRAVAHIAPIQCLTPADAAAAALSVRERRRAFFFVEQPRPVANAPQPVKPEMAGVVPEKIEVIPPMETTLAEKFMAPIEEVHSLGRLPTLENIKVAVCNFYRIRAIDLLSARRTQNICIPRQVAMWFSRRATLHSYPAIGRYFGGRDHTTAINAVARIDERMASGHEVNQHIAHITDALRAKGFTVDLPA